MVKLVFSHARAAPIRSKGFMSGVSIVIPTVNEADNIDPLFERIFAAGLPEHVSLEIVVVDDSSTDETRSRVRRWAALKPVTLVCREDRDGLANAVVAGAKAAAHDHVLVMDADLSHPPEKIAEMIQPLLDGSCDMVIGSRYVKGGATPQWPVTRKIASKLASLPACLFTDVKDPMAGFFAVSKQRLSTLRHDIPGFKIGFELLAQGGDTLSVQEIPIVFHDRFEGFSKMNKTVIFEYFKQVVQLSGFAAGVFSTARLLTLIVLGVLI
ncbi:MAG: polyprenol monophosphomannose synthase, partial [Desulfocapsaceae bacterium]|nr:polyprenol monophosphomannose synthase [Desulfocapsaceae bacterium]